MKRLSPALTILVLILAVLTFANCKTTAPEKTDDSAVETTMGGEDETMDEQGISELANTAWAIEEIDGNSVVASPDAATLEFLAEGQLAGNASCNRMMGEYEHGEADGEITFKLGGLTMMMCEEELMDQEKRLLEMLPNITSYVKDGTTLTLQTADEKTILARIMDQKPSAELVGGEWFIEAIDGQGVLENSPASFTFAADGKLSGDGSCNNMMGTYEKSDDGKLSLKLGGTTKMMCPEELMKQDKSLMDIFEKVSGYSIDDAGVLTLTTDDGKTVTARRR